MRPRVHYFGGQGIGWALDEDLAQARAALGGRVRCSSFARAPIIHSAWWPPLLQAGARALAGKSVICFADNPPAFYLTCPGFESAAARVDLWIARSREAVRQFEELRLPVTFAPYTIDSGVFTPLSTSERRSIRSRLGFSDEDFVVGNFHRDSLASDVSRPKAQKGPDRLVEIVAGAAGRIPRLKVLLAGPRRHWLRRELGQRGIPFVFFGTERDADDFDENIQPRAMLNRLYAALDCVVVSSRWEGGPYSVLEGLFAGRPVISTPVGMAADLLDGWVFGSDEAGSNLLVQVAGERPDFSALREAALMSHSREVLAENLERAYARFPGSGVSLVHASRALVALVLARLHPKLRPAFGVHGEVARAMGEVRAGRADRAGVIREAVQIAEAAAA